MPEEELAQALKGNPAGQDGQQTPVVLVRQEIMSRRGPA